MGGGRPGSLARVCCHVGPPGWGSEWGRPSSEHLLMLYLIWYGSSVKDSRWAALRKSGNEIRLQTRPLHIERILLVAGEDVG